MMEVRVQSGSGYMQVDEALVLQQVKGDTGKIKLRASAEFETKWGYVSTTVADLPLIAKWLTTRPEGQEWCPECQNWVVPEEWHQAQKWGYSEGEKCPAGHILSSEIGGWWVQRQRAKLDAAERVRANREGDLGHHHLAP